MQQFHSIAYAWPNATRLLLEWKDGEEGDLLTLPVAVPFLVECRQERKPDLRAPVPPLCWRETEDSLFEPVQ
ncbi:MAG: hypothetical protein ACKOAU_16290, partial [Pirellula sp.]